MTESHTPGPWKQGGRCGHLKDEITDSGGAKVVAVAWTRKFDRSPDAGHLATVADLKGEANARLIITAPELLEALEGIETVYAEYIGLGPDAAERSFELVQEAVRKARAVRAKVNG